MSTPETPPTGASEQEVPVCYRHRDRESHIRCQRCDRPICPDCMRPASVGFQCPECVKEGSRTTRSGRTAYGGKRSGNPALTSQVLIAVNVAVWVAILVTGWESSPLIDRLALLPQGALFSQPNGGVVQVTGVSDGAPWLLLTSMFTHVAIWHIGFNMLALYALGPSLESAIGRTRFLILYFLSGLASGATVLWLSGEHSQTLGASGAVFGLMGALLVIALKVGGDVRGILTWIGINFAITIIFASFISWQGHLGGFVAGVLIGGAIVYAPREHRVAFQAAGIAAVAVLVVVATAVRIAILG
jgi:membrane associated rhomboid family serine protease